MMRAVRALASCCLLLMLSGCALPFYWQAIGGQLSLLRKRTPIETLIEDPKVDPKLKATLTAVADIRRFAVEDLELPDNDSYTTYVALDRPYVVWNVVAADEFSIAPKRWCFPFAGCVAYRGFFARSDAERFEARLEREGLDTYSGGSTAYSTLGYFADPVLSTMIGGGDQYVASLLFHELAHQKLYIKDDSEFSEAFATTIEEYGTERWLRTHSPPAALNAYGVRLRHRSDFAALVAAQQARLKAIYARPDPPDVMRAAKAQAFATMRADYAALKVQWGGSSEYDAWFAGPLNNATLAAVATYRRWVPGLRGHLDAVGLDAFYVDTAALAKLSAAERTAQLTAWLKAASAAPLASPESG